MRIRSYRILYLLFVSIILLTPTSIAPLVPSAQAQGSSSTLWISPDLDGDGLPNGIETNGWCNTRGCFQTDPSKADSDSDGLSDGYEKLFESSPRNRNSPGIYVIYQNSFKTKQYYPWQPYGAKLIARGDDFDPPRPDSIDVQTRRGTNLDAVVVRRGATFYVGGPSNASLEISKSTSGLTGLQADWDPLIGMWRVRVPQNGTVGKYTLSMDGNSLDLFVIFEVPSASGQLTQKGIEKFLYDDALHKRFDDISILMYDEQRSDPNGFEAIGHSYPFYNHQYNRYMLEEYVMPAINGETTLRGAAQALTNEVDKRTVFRNPRPLTSSWRVLHPGSNPRQQCSNISGLLSAFSRSVGIPARPVIVDWRDDTFDHSTEIWDGDSWRVYRGYRTFEMGSGGDNTHLGCSDPQWPRCGTIQNLSRPEWARQRYKPWHSGGSGDGNVIVLADENWQTEGGTGFRWRSWSVRTIYLNEYKLMTQHTEYWQSWGWNSEPEDLSDTPPPANTIAAASGRSDLQSPLVQLGDIVAEYGVDLNGNGQYDQLVLEAEVTASQPGSYWLLGQLGTDHPEQLPVGTGMLVSQALARVGLVEGSQIVKLVFDGTEISLKRVNGPYPLSSLRIIDAEEPDPVLFANDSLAYRGYLYTTQPYRADEFETYGATLSGNYTHAEADSNGDSVPDTLVVTTGVTVYEPGNYTVEASLYDAQDQFVAQATWTGSGPDVSLRFEGVAGTVGPYTVRDLDLINSEGQSIDYLPEAYKISPIAALAKPAVASLSVLPSGAEGLMAAGQTITPTHNFAESIVDGDLQVQAEVQVSQPGSYKLEAWLADRAGNLLTWAMGQPSNLSPGTHMLSLTFRGPAIRARGVSGPYQVVALKILAGNGGYNVLDGVNIALTTRPYELNGFTNSANVVFEDFVENGGGRWAADNGWEITQEAAFSPSHAWYASDANASLTLKRPVNLARSASLALRFQTAYQFGQGERGYVEASSDGVAWDRLEVFSGTRNRSTRVVDLSKYAVYDTLYLRFRLASAGGAQDRWIVDDILIAGKPDSDNDGISNEDEQQSGTNPADPDSDDDGMLDGWEVLYGLDPLRNDAQQDLDRDGLTNLQEYRQRTDPRDADSDGDRLSDGDEVKVYGTNPNRRDTDGDRLSDFEEVKTYGTNPHKRDSDGDGLSDYAEVKTHGTNPHKRDSDGDGLSDRAEVKTHGTNPNDPDSDDDGLPDDWEVANGLNPLNASDANQDPDNDGLTNREEYQTGTDPRNPDTDHDGVPDGRDPSPRPKVWLSIIRK